MKIEIETSQQQPTATNSELMLQTLRMNATGTQPEIEWLEKHLEIFMRVAKERGES